MDWRDIRAGLVEVTRAAFEPISRAEAKWHARIDVADEDVLVDAYIAAARRQLVKDTGHVPVNETFDWTIDAFPSDRRSLTLPRWPVASVSSVTSYDENDAATTFSSGDYRVDTALGRLILNDDASWPSGLRRHSGGVIRFVAGGNGTAVSVSSLTSSGTAPSITATATTSSAHGFSTGDRRTIVGAAQDAYNGTFVIAVTGATTFTYTVVSGTPATPATGTITVRDLAVPETHRLAMLLLITQWYEHRSPVADVSGERFEMPMAYEALIGGADRVYAVA